MENTSTPKNFFLQIGIIASLYISIVSFLSFVFDLINTLLPDPVGGYSYYSYDSYSSSIRFAISTLVVVFPLFIFLSRLYRKLVAKDAVLKESRIRKWLLYFTLFLAGATIATDLIILINTFLQGTDLTARFFLKSLSVFIIAGIVFYFYLKDIKGYWEENAKAAKIFARVISGVVLATIITGFVLIGSPADQRKKMNDGQRQSDLIQIQSEITYFYQQKGRLPKDLSELTDPLSGIVVPKDPVTKEVYEYKATAPLSFQICATFDLPSSDSSQIAMPADYMNQVLEHGAGRTCFDRTIDPDRYPLIRK